MKILLVEAQLKKFGRVKDGSMTLGFTTLREITNEEFSLVDQYYQQNGHLAFKMDAFVGNEIPDTNTNVPGARSPSTILRNALFAKHMGTGGKKEDFPVEYQKAINRFITETNDSWDD